MDQLNQLMQALQAQRAQMVQNEAALAGLEDDRLRANTRSFRGLIPGLIETAVDAHKRKKLEPQYTAALEQAMNSAAGYDDVAAQLAALQAQQQSQITRRDEMADYAAKEALKADQGIRRDQAKPATPTALMQNIAAMGVDPRSPEGRKLMEQYLTKGQTQINIPAPPTGYFYNNPTDPRSGISPVPGSPQEMEAATAQQEAARNEQKTAVSRMTNREKYGGILGQVDEALSLTGKGTTGIPGAIGSRIPGTPARDLRATLDTIKANIAFGELRNIRVDPENKTGGALGNVSERELGLLQNVLASLEQETSEPKLRSGLERVRDHYSRFLDAADGRMPEGYNERGEWMGEKSSKRTVAGYIIEEVE